MQHDYILSPEIPEKKTEKLNSLISIPDGSHRCVGKGGVFSFELERDDSVRAHLARPLPQLIKHVLIEVLLKYVTKKGSMINSFRHLGKTKKWNK